MTMTATPSGTVPTTAPPTPPERPRRGNRPARIALHIFLAFTALSFLAPLLWTVYTSLRPYSDTAEHGYFSLPRKLGFENYADAWNQAELMHYYGNTLLVTLPTLLLVLFLSSFVAYAVSRYSWRGNIALLILFTAGNLLPPQAMLTPLYRMYNEIPLPESMSDSLVVYDSYWGIIAIHVAFQMGFCTFVLSNYMKTIPHELTEAAIVDGASVFRQYWQVILPLCRPPLAALATLEFTWVYNDFLWALVLMQTGDKRPITSALGNLQGVYFTNNNLIAAASLLAAIPTLVVYFALQRQFIGGLTLGASKG
ncbi:carbohydrate ABC transporter permease [Wenjunlia tyrosinilytica]|uniref:ABC transporter permease n=1 Tax=Wenjunlia tyrosinilytica TaxID=1544741 RepID=A0A918E070_9ACTN|nr:carbohydrate ABC transporter permease [Wenjunlia tyrosinilytica]GGO96165.1 ABC transporter permease [Wenjunlia tyrosinilytica]